MATLEQKRAQLAFDHVTKVDKSDKLDSKKYASIVHTMPTLLRSAGLSQALHFVASRPDDTQRMFLSHLAVQLKRIDSSITTPEALLDQVRKAELPRYLRLTNEALACATWYRRFVQSILKIDAADADKEK